MSAHAGRHKISTTKGGTYFIQIMVDVTSRDHMTSWVL